MTTFYPECGEGCEMATESQAGEYRTLVTKYHPNGTREYVMRYKDNQLDGGAKPAMLQWNENGELIVSRWFSAGKFMYDDMYDPAELPISDMNPREDCIGVICAAMIIAGLITMFAILCSTH